jgi:signal transduction histidine kinase
VGPQRNGGGRRGNALWNRLIGWLRSGQRTRGKLALILVPVALLPTVATSFITNRFVLERLEEQLIRRAEQSVDVAFNLVLNQVQRVGADANLLGENQELRSALRGEGAGSRREFIRAAIERVDEHLVPGVFEIANTDGKIVGRYETLTTRHATALQSHSGDPLIARALALETHVVFDRGTGPLVVRVAAPVVDEDLTLLGAVTVTFPLDDRFADSLKGEIGSEVLLHRNRDLVATSMVDPDGVRLRPPGSATAQAALQRGDVSSGWEFFQGKRYAAAYLPLRGVDRAPVGVIGVAVPEDELAAVKQRTKRYMALTAVMAGFLALGLAALLARSVTRPLQRLHAGVSEIARGNLDLTIALETRDEFGELASAFNTMTRSLKENRDSLAARMREILTLHEFGRAVTAVLELEDVSRLVVNETAKVLGAGSCALYLADPDGTLSVRAEVGLPPEALGDRRAPGEPIAGWVAREGHPVVVDDVDDDPVFQGRRGERYYQGSLAAVPLVRRGGAGGQPGNSGIMKADRVIGVLLAGRRRLGGAFSAGDLRLVSTLAAQSATAIENARLYQEVMAFNDELERKVTERTKELYRSKNELETALTNLTSAQSQLVHSERMAGVGTLVAGLAHEINTPAGSIRGAITNLGENISAWENTTRKILTGGLPAADLAQLFQVMDDLRPFLRTPRIESPVVVRRKARELAPKLSPHADPQLAKRAAQFLVELDAESLAPRVAGLLLCREPDEILGFLQAYAYLHLNIAAMESAISSIVRIVGALKSYSHLDQAELGAQDLHEGIENTLVILHHYLKYGINVTKRFGSLPPVRCLVGELNQVWTNIIHNAIQAMGGRGDLVIETKHLNEGGLGDSVSVAITDSGSGIPPEVQPRIFEPFFTTKPKGEGTGLGLGIARQIVERHGGRIAVRSRPGETTFEITLPVSGPPDRSTSGRVLLPEHDPLAKVIVGPAGQTGKPAA